MLGLALAFSFLVIALVAICQMVIYSNTLTDSSKDMNALRGRIPRGAEYRIKCRHSAYFIENSTLKMVKMVNNYGNGTFEIKTVSTDKFEQICAKVFSVYVRRSDGTIFSVKSDKLVAVKLPTITRIVNNSFVDMNGVCYHFDTFDFEVITKEASKHNITINSFRRITIDTNNGDIWEFDSKDEMIKVNLLQ